MSVVPPEAAGTMTLVPWLGFQADWAPRPAGSRTAPGKAAAPVKAARRERRRIIVSSHFCIVESPVTWARESTKRACRTGKSATFHVSIYPRGRPRLAGLFRLVRPPSHGVRAKEE